MLVLNLLLVYVMQYVYHFQELNFKIEVEVHNNSLQPFMESSSSFGGGVGSLHLQTAVQRKLKKIRHKLPQGVPGATGHYGHGGHGGHGGGGGGPRGSKDPNAPLLVTEVIENNAKNIVGGE